MKFKFTVFFTSLLVSHWKYTEKNCVLNELDIHLLFGYYECTVVYSARPLLRWLLLLQRMVLGHAHSCGTGA